MNNLDKLSKSNDKSNKIKLSIDNFKTKLPLFIHYSSRQQWENACWNKIINSKSFLKSLITSYERHNLVMRAAVISNLILGKKCKKISEELSLSRQTIDSIRKAVKENNYRSYRERGKTERKKRIFTIDHRKPKEYRRRIRTKYGPMYVNF